MTPPRKRKRVRELVKVCRTLSPKELQLLEPWFRSRQESFEIRRTKTMPELRKWPSYYATWGCLCCKKKKTPHRALGFCLTCYLRVSQRIKEILKEAERHA